MFVITDSTDSNQIPQISSSVISKSIANLWNLHQSVESVLSAIRMSHKSDQDELILKRAGYLPPLRKRSPCPCPKTSAYYTRGGTNANPALEAALSPGNLLGRL
jgi:hypothetical protein